MAKINQSCAKQLSERVKGNCAWNFTPQEKALLVRKTKNGYGTSYRFIDGSIAFVYKGEARVWVR